MSPSPGHARNKRRATRKRANFTCEVIDVISDQVIGHLGDLSINGLMLIGSRRPENGAILQLRLPLYGVEARPHEVEIGVQAMWHRGAANPGQIWAGYRIIAISDAHATTLRTWLALPE